MSAETVAAIDPARYPKRLSCSFCESTDGHDEEVWTGNQGEADLSGFEIWFCCHACRDAGLPCETFFPIRLKPGATP